MIRIQTGDLRGTQYQDGVAYTEGEAYQLQTAFQCAGDYWRNSAEDLEGLNDPQSIAMRRMAQDEAARYDKLKADLEKQVLNAA